MILDTAKVVFADGTEHIAVDVLPGKDLASPTARITRVLDRKIEERSEVITLMLSTGTAFTGTRDQRVFHKGKRANHRCPLEDIEIGDFILGNVNGMPTSIRVIGIVFTSCRPRRVVFIQTMRPFIAEGVVCRC